MNSVLIYVLVIYVGGYSGHAIQQEFYGIERCEAARIDLLKQINTRMTVWASGCYIK